MKDKPIDDRSDPDGFSKLADYYCQPRVENSVAESIAKDICQDLQWGRVPGCGKCLAAEDVSKARAYIALVVCQHSANPNRRNGDES